MTAPVDRPATVLVERRGQMDFLFLFLAAVGALVAWRGWDGARIAAIVAGVFAVVMLGAWIRWRLLPTPELRISRREIWYGRPGTAGRRIEASPSKLLRFEQAHERSGWLLVDAGRPEGPSLFFLGFDLAAIQRAAEDQGWRFPRASSEPEAPTIGPCAVCGTSIPEGRQFCGTCGTSVWVSCPSCGTQNRNGAATCSTCGTALPQPPRYDTRPVDPGVMPVRPFDILGDPPVVPRPGDGPPPRPPAPPGTA